jgi:biotin operon repressor
MPSAASQRSCRVPAKTGAALQKIDKDQCYEMHSETSSKVQAPAGENAQPTFRANADELIRVGRVVTSLNRLGLAIEDRRCDRSHLRVLYSIMKRLNGQTGTAFPSWQAMASEHGISTAAVRNSLIDLRKWGYLIWEDNGGLRRYTLPVLAWTAEDLAKAIMAHRDNLKAKRHNQSGAPNTVRTVGGADTAPNTVHSNLLNEPVEDDDDARTRERVDHSTEEGKRMPPGERLPSWALTGLSAPPTGHPMDVLLDSKFNDCIVGSLYGANGVYEKIDSHTKLGAPPETVRLAVIDAAIRLRTCNKEVPAERLIFFLRGIDIAVSERKSAARPASPRRLRVSRKVMAAAVPEDAAKAIEAAKQQEAARPPNEDVVRMYRASMLGGGQHLAGISARAELEAALAYDRAHRAKAS